MTSSTLLADPPSNETIDVFYIKTESDIAKYEYTMAQERTAVCAVYYTHTRGVSATTF